MLATRTSSLTGSLFFGLLLLLAGLPFARASAPGADLSVTKTDSTDPVRAGSNLTYTITVENFGPEDALGVVVTDTLPAEVTFLSSVVGASGAITSGLQLYYSFDTDEGGVVTDQSGNDYTGTVNGATFTNAGIVGGAYGFDGSDWIEAGDILDLAGAVSQLTVCVWVKGPPTSSTWDDIVAKQNLGSPFTGWAMAINPATGAFSQVIATHPELSAIDGTSNIGDGEWHLFCATMEVTTNALRTQVYVDGVLEGSDERLGSHDSTDATSPLTIGARAPGGSQGYTGVLDELKIYDRLLASNEIYSLSTPCTVSNGVVVCSVGDLASGQNVTINIDVLVDAPPLYAITNSVSVTSATDDLSTGNNATTEVTGVTFYQVDLSVTKIDSVDPVFRGEDLVYTITVSNAGPDHAADVLVTDVLPGTVTFSSAFARAVSGITNGLSLYYPFDVDEGGTVTDQSVNDHTGAVNGATFTNEGFVGGAYQFDGDDWIDSGDALDLVGSVSQLTVCAWIKVEEPPAPAQWDVVASKQDDSAPYRGWAVALNPGTGGFSQVIATHPELSASDGMANLDDGQWHFLCSTFDVSADALRTQIYVDGILEGSHERLGAHGSTESSSSLIIGARDPGGVQGYKGLLDELRVYERLLSSNELYEMSAPCSYSSGLVTCLIGTMPSGAVASIDVAVHVGTNAVPILTNSVSVTNATFDITTSNNNTSELTAVISEVDLSVFKSDTPDPANVDSNLTYTITVSNAGPAVAFGVVITDALPVEVTSEGVPTHELVLYYSFDQDEGGVVSDLSGNSYTGVVFGATYTNDGFSGGAQSFDGGDWIDAGDVLGLAGNISQLTVCAWAKVKVPPAAGAWDVLASKQDNDSPFRGWAVAINPATGGFSQVIATHPELSASDGASNIDDEQWHLIVSTLESAAGVLRTQIYVDGILEGSDERLGAHGSTAAASSLIIGARDPGGVQGYKGLLDELRIYRRILSSNEIYSMRFACEATNGVVVCDVGQVAAGESISIELSAMIVTSLIGQVSNDVSVTASSPDTNLANNTAYALTTLPDTDGDLEPDFVDTDDDNDALPDEWELRYAAAGLDPAVSNSPSSDFDMDGLTDLQEYISDTVPTDSNSFFMAEGIISQSPPSIFFQSSTGRIYTLQYIEDLMSVVWSNVPGQTDVPGSGGSDSLSDTVVTNGRSYRVEVELP